MQFNRGTALGLASLLIMVIFSCTIIPLALGDNSSDNATRGNLLYQENFSTSKNSAWGGDLSPNLSYYFENGKYHLMVDSLNNWRPVSYGSNYTNFIIEVEATQESGPDDNTYGMILRRVDWNNYYDFLISGDGYYEIAKLENNIWAPTSWKKSSAIHTGNATNLIRVVCDGNKFSFYVNDVKLDDYTDNSFPSGTIGFTAGTNFSPGAVTIGFDNLKIWEIQK